MGKKYDLGKKSDIRKFKKDLEQSIFSNARDALAKETYKIECPKCHKTVSATAGPNVCPFCQEEINLELDFNF